MFTENKKNYVYSKYNPIEAYGGVIYRSEYKDNFNGIEQGELLIDIVFSNKNINSNNVFTKSLWNFGITDKATITLSDNYDGTEEANTVLFAFAITDKLPPFLAEYMFIGYADKNATQDKQTIWEQIKSCENESYFYDFKFYVVRGLKIRF